MDLVVGVWGYKSKPHSLLDAFRRARTEEIRFSLKELSRKNDADEVFEEMSHPNSINIANTIGAEGISHEDNYSLVDASGNMATNEGFNSMQAPETVIGGDKVLGGMFKPACTPEAIFIFPKARNHLLDEVGQLHSLKFEGLRDTRQLFDEMPCPISIKHNDENDSHENLVLPTIGLLKILSYGEAAPEFHLLKLEGLKDAQNVFDKMLQQFLAGHEKWEPSMVDFTRDLGSKGDETKDGSANSSSKMMFGEMGVFMFDPGISSWHRKGCAFINSSEMPSNSNVELWVGKVLFLFDPGGCVSKSTMQCSGGISWEKMSICALTTPYVESSASLSLTSFMESLPAMIGSDGLISLAYSPPCLSHRLSSLKGHSTILMQGPQRLSKD